MTAWVYPFVYGTSWTSLTALTTLTSLTGLTYFFGAWGPTSWRPIVLGLAGGLHALVLWHDWHQIPFHFGFALALSSIVWWMAVIYALEGRWWQQRPPRNPLQKGLCALGALTVILPLFFPGYAIQAATEPPRLFWIHVGLGLWAYGLLALAGLHALWWWRLERRLHEGHPLLHTSGTPHTVPLLTLERLTWGFVALSTLFLSLSLGVGIWFSQILYGHDHAWLTTHKTIFGLLAWVTLVVLWIGHHWRGWRGRGAMRALALALLFLLLAYVGSRFVTEVLLHRSSLP
jgi:ABC-type uncharacterized transport system permease subunit